MKRGNLAFKKRHHRSYNRNALTAIQQKRLLHKTSKESPSKKEADNNNKVNKKLSNVSDISDWIRKNKKEEHFSPEKDLRPYRKFEKTTQGLIRWQALYLINNGLSFSRTAQLLNIHRNTASLWWRQHLNSDAKLSSTKVLNKSFKHLTPEMKSVLIKQLFVFKEEERIQETIAGMLTLINDDLASKWLQSYNEKTSSLEKPTPVAFSNYNVELFPLDSNKTNLVIVNNDLTNSSKALLPERLIPSYFKTGAPDDNELEVLKSDSPLDKPKDVKQKAPIISKLKKLIGLSVDRVADSIIGETEAKTGAVSLSEQDLPSFYLADPDAFIQLSSNTKIIKEKDYAMYCESSDLLQASKDFLNESKQRAVILEEQAIESAHAKAEEIIEAAKEQGVREADNLLAEKSIEATKASIEHLASLEASLPELIMSIVRKIIIDYDDQEFVIKNIKTAVKNLSECEEIKIHMSPNIISSVNEQLVDTTYAGKITLIPDSSLKDKDCLIVTNLGVINACLETQLQKIESEMAIPSQENGHHVTVAF
jgi:flagellar biosynthesis/type III secretory pathway protein FliH/transposase-like protein